MNHVCRHVKGASKATAQGIKTVSKSTIITLKEVEEKHHVVRKSKNSIKKGGRMIRNVWHGKPWNTRPVPSTSTSRAKEDNDHLDQEDSEERASMGLVLELDAAASKIPLPSSE